MICLRRRTKKKIRRATERRRSRHGTAVDRTTGGAVVASLDTKPEGGVAEGEEEKPKPVSVFGGLYLELICLKFLIVRSVHY